MENGGVVIGIEREITPQACLQADVSESGRSRDKRIEKPVAITL